MKQTPDVPGGMPQSPARILWVYGFEATVSVGEPPLPAIRGVLAGANRAARLGGRGWTARLVPRDGGAQILVVSASRDAAGDRNGDLAARLTSLGIDLFAFLPMAIRRL
jgi:hypothetical protein